MKMLGLLRHAKSSWKVSTLNDFDRPLAPRGAEAAFLMGVEFRRLGLGFELILASPARRVVETIANLAEGYGSALEPRYVPELYDASASRLLAILSGLNQSFQKVLLVGHNPGLQDLVVALANDHDPLVHRIIDKFPTGALALLELRIGDWREIGADTGKIVAFTTPSDLRRD